MWIIKSYKFIKNILIFCQNTKIRLSLLSINKIDIIIKSFDHENID